MMPTDTPTQEYLLWLAEKFADLQTEQGVQWAMFYLWCADAL